MWISDISIRRPVFATMVIMSFMVLGIVSMTRLGIDLFPEVNFPFVNISVIYPGASPEEVETLVTRPIEDAVAGINGVKRVISSSTESRAVVGLELRLEVDPQAAAAEVREKVAAIRSRLPAQIEDPTIVRFDVAALPIMTFAVGSSQRSDITRRQIEDDLKPLLEQIDGVAAVEPAVLPLPAFAELSGLPLQELAFGSAAIFLVSFGSGIITARTFGAIGGYQVDPNRELVGFGAANIAAGLIGAIPVSASDSRTAVNLNVGGRSQVASVVAAATLLAALLFLAPALQDHPDSRARRDPDGDRHRA